MEIKKIKDFLADKEPQFRVLFRYGPIVNFVIYNPGEAEFRTQLYNKKGVIRIVQRIVDDSVICLCNYITSDINIIEFSEDLVHCIGYNSKTKEKQVFEINSIKTINSISEFELTDMQLPEDVTSKIRQASNYEKNRILKFIIPVI